MTRSATEPDRTQVVDVIEQARTQISTPDVSSIHATYRRRHRNRRIAGGIACFAAFAGLVFVAGAVRDTSNSVETASPANERASDVTDLELGDLAIAETSWFVTSDVGFAGQSEGEVLERIEFFSIEGETGFQLSGRCTSAARQTDWTSTGFTVGDALPGAPVADNCREGASGFAVRSILPGAEVAAAMVDGQLTLSNEDADDAWMLSLTPISVGLPNEIGQLLLDFHGWQYHDGAGDFDRTGIGFPEGGDDEILGFSSDEAPLDVITLGTGCEVAAHKIEWNEAGFEVLSSFVTGDPIDDVGCGSVTDGVATTPLADGASVLVSTDGDTVTLMSAESGESEWSLILQVPPTN